MLVLLNGALTIRRTLIADFLMGLCFGVSMKTLLLVMSILIGGSVTLIFVGRERLGIGSGLVQIIAPDVGTVMGVLDGEQYERKERVLSAGIHTFVQTSTDTASESFGRRPSIATSDRSSLIARLAAESDCAVLLSLLLTRVSFLT